MEATLTPAKTGLEGAANGKRSGLGAIRWHQERWASLSARRGHGQRGADLHVGGFAPPLLLRLLFLSSSANADTLRHVPAGGDLHCRNSCQGNSLPRRGGWEEVCVCRGGNQLFLGGGGGCCWLSIRLPRVSLCCGSFYIYYYYISGPLHCGTPPSPQQPHTPLPAGLI